jgi:exopolysaccharide production protein ExoZ
MIKNIQYLRFLAAFMVVFAHSNLQIYGFDTRTTNIGGFGVDLFFVISGFIMPFIIYGGLYREHQSPLMDAGGFMWRRITRIWPMYTLTILMVMLISALVAKGTISNPTADLAYLFNASKIEPAWFLETITFTHWVRPPILGIGWTLQVEFLFYAAIAIVLLLRAKTLEALEVGLLAFFFVAFMVSPISLIASSLSNAMIIEFMLGVFLYRIVSRGVLMPKAIAAFVALGSIPAFLTIEYQHLVNLSGLIYRPIAWGIPAFFFVWSALSLEHVTKDVKWLSLLGDASYSLYLVHGFVAPLFAFFWVNHGLESSIPYWIYLPAYLIVCQAAGLLAHLYVEKPINNAVRKFKRVRRKCEIA